MTERILIVCGGSGVGLLGQRQALGMAAELQIDVKDEIVINRMHCQDPCSFSVTIDENMETTQFLFERSVKKMVDKPSEADENSSTYARWYVYEEADKKHLQFLADRYLAVRSPLKWDFAQSPAIGGLAIRDEQNRKRLESVFDEMLGGMTLGPANDLEVWIVSSTAGGTGEGIHRFVGAYLAEHLRKGRYGTSTPVSLNFIRVGQVTYSSTDKIRTAMNTFFGVAADAAFSLKMRDDFKTVSVNWYYTDLPDVGAGDQSKPIRAELVEMAAKSILLEELQGDLQALLVNNLGAPMIPVRIGYWGKDFGRRRKYMETLGQLMEKLQELVSPDYNAILEEESAPRFEKGETLEGLQDMIGNAKYVLSKVRGGWRFPSTDSKKGVPNDKKVIEEKVAEWKRATVQLVSRDWSRVQARYLVDVKREAEGGLQTQTVPLEVPADLGKVGEGMWFSRIREVHEILAWTRKLMGCDLDSGAPMPGEGVLSELFNVAGQISKGLNEFRLYAGTKARVSDVSPLLPKFVELLAQVDLLLGVENGMQSVLDSQLKEVGNVLAIAKDEYETLEQGIRSSGTSRVVIAADLSDPLDRSTGESWLQLLMNATRREDRDVFKAEVMRGATRLTGSGLKVVLGLPPQADINMIHDEMARMGRMYSRDGKEYEAPWWAGRMPVENMFYEYRILPPVESRLKEEFERLMSGRCVKYKYVFTPMGTIGLYALALHGGSLTTVTGDYSEAPKVLLKPFVNSVRNALCRWAVKGAGCDEASGQKDIVMAGVGGEPLYKAALVGAGLTEAELKKLAEFYQFYPS